MPGQHQQHNHRPAPRPAPEPSGELVSAFARPGYRGGPDGELRVSVDQYQNHPYISIRLWEAGPDGQWFPTRKGLSVRLGEAEGVAEALLKGLALAERDQHRRAVGPARPDRYQLQEQRPAPARQQQPRQQPQRALPAPASVAAPAPAFDTSFDEFSSPV